MDTLLNFIPEDVRDLAPEWVWYATFGFAALVALLLALGVLSFVLRVFKGRPTHPGPNLEERFAEYPPLPPSTGDRRLLVEGVPVRLRLVIVAPAGTESRFDPALLEKLLERVLPGLGGIFAADKPRVRVWPTQLSHEGFANHLHRNTIVPEGDGQLSKWVVVAGRARLPDCHVMLGLGLEALKPTTVGRRTIEAHEWASVLRVRVRD
jgi:hypothetical protein